tara:strand:+ start:751 stop:882 length:132 start_codon:yes stop_codon:yes gene_type:complete
MPVPLRRFYGNKLIEAKNKEAESYKKSTQDSTQEIARPTFRKS